MWNSEGASLVSGCDRLFGWSLGYYYGSLLGIRPGVNIGFKDRTLVGLVLGGVGVDVSYMGSSDGVMGG